jgi:hypothetical protein
MTPFMASSQINDSVLDQLEVEGCRMGLNSRLKHRQKLYMCTALFQEQTTTVLTPFMNKLWANEQFAGKPAILQMDNCSIHARPKVLPIFRELNLKGITFPPDTTQIFQTFGLSRFGVFKRKL